MDQQEFDLALHGTGEAFRRCTEVQASSILAGRPYHSLVRDGKLIEGLISIEALRHRLDLLGVPTDLRGARALDIGSASGWNTFEMERRGADVTAIDYVADDDFLLHKALTHSKVTYYEADVEIDNLDFLGTFDIVLFLGVLYHLRSPIRALESLCRLTSGIAYLETYVIDSHSELPGHGGRGHAVEFYDKGQLGGQIDNWWGPSQPAVAAMCRASGFATIDFLYTQDRRAGYRCSRNVPLLPTALSEQPLWISGTASNIPGKSYFRQQSEEYVLVYFESIENIEKLGGIIVRVGAGLAPIVNLSKLSDIAFQASARLPPYLMPGIHNLTIRTASSPWSNEVEIEVRERGAPRRLEVLDVVIPEIPPAMAETANEVIILTNIEVHVRPLLVADDSRLVSITVYFRRPDSQSNEGCSAHLRIDSAWFPMRHVQSHPDGRVQCQVERVYLTGTQTTAIVQVFVSPCPQLSNRVVVNFGSERCLHAFL